MDSQKESKGCLPWDRSFLSKLDMMYHSWVNPVLGAIIKNLQSLFDIEDMKLSRDEINLIEAVLQNMPHEDCKTCDCFLGFITQLELDSQEDVRDITGKLKPSRDQIHGCLGCDPCPPAEAYTNYLRQKLGSKADNQHRDKSYLCSPLSSIARKQNTLK